jgi:hypothetical protein
MDMTEAAEAISSRIGAFDGLGDDRPDHVLVRAALLVGEEEIVYVDDNLSRSLDSVGWSGDVLIFTSSRVIRLTLSEATDDSTDREHSSSAEATSWARASLGGVTLLGTDQAWEETPMAAFPETAGLRLTYTGGQATEIPSRWEAGAGRSTREGAFELLPSLWSDLAAVS